MTTAAMLVLVRSYHSIVRELAEIMAACDELKACVRFHWLLRNDVDHVVKCFADRRVLKRSRRSSVEST